MTNQSPASVFLDVSPEYLGLKASNDTSCRMQPFINELVVSDINIGNIVSPESEPGPWLLRCISDEAQVRPVGVIAEDPAHAGISLLQTMLVREEKKFSAVTIGVAPSERSLVRTANFIHQLDEKGLSDNLILCCVDGMVRMTNRSPREGGRFLMELVGIMNFSKSEGRKFKSLLQQPHYAVGR